MPKRCFICDPVTIRAVADENAVITGTDIKLTINPAMKKLRFFYFWSMGRSPVDQVFLYVQT